jgi:hypothetical protein
LPFSIPVVFSAAVSFTRGRGGIEVEVEREERRERETERNEEETAREKRGRERREKRKKERRNCSRLKNALSHRKPLRSSFPRRLVFSLRSLFLRLALSRLRTELTSEKLSAGESISALAAPKGEDRRRR